MGIKKVKDFDVDYISDLIADMLDTEDKPCTPKNVVNKLHMLDTTTYLDDISKELEETLEKYNVKTNS